MAKTAKKTGAGTRAAERSGPPIHIRNFGAPITADDRDYVRQKLAARLAPFGKRVERASVRIEDVNGPRGGIDKRCRIKVVLSGVTSVTAEEQEAVLRIAIDGALRRIAIAVRRAVERRQGPRPAPRRTRAALAGSEE
ncbi:MAG TPA: HPF/RaiA family ribosome-associated protein [Zeimonas sp.]|nr:HPF/RaiA family ribosome-associated protein [Zeimonas sp.]